MIKKLSYIYGSVFGVGYLPGAPGTFGSLATLPMVWYAFAWRGLEGVWAVILIAYILGIFAVREILKDGKHDPGFVVIDEVAGQAMVFVLVPEYLDQWWVYVVGFVLFRMFDIFKIGPVKWADEKMENETGVMLDDVIAGLIGAVLLKLMLEF